MLILRWLLKLVTLPLVLFLSLIQWASILVVSVSSSVMNLLLSLVWLVLFGSWIFGLATLNNSMPGLILCLILLVVPQIAQWCVVRIAALNSILKDFVRS